MDIRKVKSTNGCIVIRAEEASGEEAIRRIELESRAEPRPEFHEAMGGLIAPALDMIQAPRAWMDVATISSLSLTHEEERGIGAVVTILVPLECAPSPLVINTPYLISHLTGGPTLPDDLRQAIERVINEALRYLHGDRAQGDLFRGSEEDLSVRSPRPSRRHVRGVTQDVPAPGWPMRSDPEPAFDDEMIYRALPSVTRTTFSERPGDTFFDSEMIYRALTKHDADGEELKPAHIVAGKLVVGSADLAEAMQEQTADGPIKPPVGGAESAAEPEPLIDGPVRDRPAHEVRAEFERIRAEAMRKQPGIKPARGRRAMKESVK